jgi:hypothetical protein
MKTSFTLMVLAGILSILGGAERVAANPLLACEWESGQTVLGFYGEGLVATNTICPEPSQYSPHCLRLDLVAPGDPEAAAQIAWAWAPSSVGGLQVMISYYLEDPSVAQWQLQARWNDSLPGDSSADDGDAGTLLLDPVPGWNEVFFVTSYGSGHSGQVITVAPVVANPGAIWLDLLVVDGDGATIQTPCDIWVPAEGRRFGEIKALFD